MKVAIVDRGQLWGMTNDVIDVDLNSSQSESSIDGEAIVFTHTQAG
jgi:hypothetical protein